ncbi:MAG: FHA domain-containing protein [bacterium]|nr:FHA domain-containing protein [bacterium]
MAFCKVCTCGEKIVFERRLSFPDNCPSCGRKLVDFLTYNEDDSRVEELMRTNSDEKTSEGEGSVVSTESDSHKKKYILRLSNGKEIEIPDEGGIVGRTEIGAEELAEFPSVSRQHLRVTPRRNVGVLVEDISTYGTLVDGQRIVKNSPVRVADGSKVTLCDVDAVLTVKEVND